MSISLKKVIIESSKFSGLTVVSKLLSLPVMIFLGRKLGAEQFGTIASMTLVLQYAGLLTPGFINAGARDIAHYNGEGNAAVAERIESAANGADLLFTLTVFTLILFSSLFQDQEVYAVGVVIIAFIFLLDRIKTYYFNANYYRQIYNINVLANTVASVITPLASILLVFVIREYALLVAPLLSSFAVGAFYLLFSQQKIRFRWDPAETRKLFKVGIVFSLGGIAFWAFRLADRTAITLFMSKGDLGNYFYAMNFILMALNVLGDFGRILESMLWSHAGKLKEAFLLQEEIKRLSLFMACIGGAVIPVLQFAYYLLITTTVPKFAGTLHLFNVMSLSIFPGLLLMIPNIMLKSKMMDKQHSLLVAYSVAAAFNFTIDVVAVKLGYGLVTLAWLSLFTLLMVNFWLLFLTRSSVSTSTGGFVVFLCQLLLPFAALIVVYAAAGLIPQTGSSGALEAFKFVLVQTVTLIPFLLYNFSVATGTE